MGKKSTIVAFDFDETLITKDSLLDFARYSLAPATFMFKAAFFTPTLVAFKLKKITNQTAKERFLRHFFGGMSAQKFDALGAAYIQRLNEIANPEALKKLAFHKKQGDTVIIISASIANWIQPWATAIGVDRVISSRIEVKNQRVTGNLVGNNCHGPEKPKQFLAVYPKRDSYTLIVYGDGKSDKEMFKLADRYYEKRFN